MGREKRGHSSGQLPRLPRAFSKGNFISGGSLVPYLVVLLVAVIQLAMFTRDGCL